MPGLTDVLKKCLKNAWWANVEHKMAEAGKNAWAYA